MRKIIFSLLILLISFAGGKVSAQNVKKIYSSDSMTINKFFKVKTPQTGYKNGYFQLDGYSSLPNVDFRNMNVYRIMRSFVFDNMHNNAFKSYYNLCSPPFNGIAFGGVIDFTFSEQDSNLYLSSGTAAECEPYEGISYSLNNGLNRNQIFSQTFMSFAIGMAIDPVKDSIMYCVYRSGGNPPFVYKTTNRGSNWFVTDTIANTTRGIMKVNSFNPSIIFLNGASGLMRSTSSGYDFTAVSAPSAVCMEFSTSNNSIFIGTTGTNGGIYKSDQNGLVWTRIFDIGCNTIEIDPLNNNIIYAGTNNGIYRSLNNGTTWEQYNDGFTGSKSVIGIVKNPDMGDTLFAVTTKAVYKVYGGFRAFTEHNYFPLKIGNSWTYRSITNLGETGYYKTTIISDTLISGIRYYRTDNEFPYYGGNLITLDSLTGNLYLYSSNSTCSSFGFLVDSLASNLFDAVSTCPRTDLFKQCTNTGNDVIFGQAGISKYFVTQYPGQQGLERKYISGFGLTRVFESENVHTNDANLIGCVINGVLYGDTTTVSQYKPYLPLKVGNSWTYETSYDLPPTRYKTKVTIVADTIISGVKYSRTSGVLPGFTGNLIRMDTLSGNILCYSQTPSCQRYPQQLLIDSVAGKFNDTFLRCHNPSLGKITDTSDYGLPWQTVKSKKIYYTSLVDESHTYGKNFGLVEMQTIEGAPVTTRLTGCVINGVLYGDTTSVSQYKDYLPLQVGNSWTYVRRVIPLPDEEFTVTIIKDSLINGVKYFQTDTPFPTFDERLITLDTLTGNIYTYNAGLNCSYSPQKKLKDSLAAKKNDTFTGCNAGLNGKCTDTNSISVFGNTVESKSFISPYYSSIDCAQRFAKNFGIVGAAGIEVDIISYSLKRCTINGVTYSDSLRTVSGTVKFNDNSQPASDGYVKAIKLNTATGNIVTYDSVQIQNGGTYQLHGLPSDLYYIVAYPNSEKQSDFVPTYYPSNISWQSAVRVNSGNNPSDINISVFRKNNINGSYNVSGQVSAPVNSLAGIGSAIVYIKQGNYFRDFCITNGSGQYTLNNLISGSYEIIADRMGYYGAQRSVTVNNGNMENINFVLDRVGVSDITTAIPKEYNLYQNYPNPFNPVTKIKFDLPKAGFVTVKIYNVLGKEVTVLVNEMRQAGTYLADFHAENLSSGVYFYRITAGDFTETRRMMVVK